LARLISNRRKAILPRRPRKAPYAESLRIIGGVLANVIKKPRVAPTRGLMATNIL
jgi:hypothetical protein